MPPDAGKLRSHVTVNLETPMDLISPDVCTDDRQSSIKLASQETSRTIAKTGVTSYHQRVLKTK
jgi:hypothetical protein